MRLFRRDSNDDQKTESRPVLSGQVSGFEVTNAEQEFDPTIMNNVVAVVGAWLGDNDLMYYLTGDDGEFSTLALKGFLQRKWQGAAALSKNDEKYLKEWFRRVRNGEQEV